MPRIISAQSTKGYASPFRARARIHNSSQNDRPFPERGNATILNIRFLDWIF